MKYAVGWTVAIALCLLASGILVGVAEIQASEALPSQFEDVQVRLITCDQPVGLLSVSTSLELGKPKVTITFKFDHVSVASLADMPGVVVPARCVP
jgi:CTP:molybdopterin cytidylyltransferase MocA